MCFNSPIDKIVFDVSHQAYPHKILTGRKDGFLYEDKFKTVNGYTDQDEVSMISLELDILQHQLVWRQDLQKLEI